MECLSSITVDDVGMKCQKSLHRMVVDFQKITGIFILGIFKKSAQNRNCSDQFQKNSHKTDHNINTELLV